MNNKGAMSDIMSNLYGDFNDYDVYGHEFRDTRGVLEFFFSKYFEVFEGSACSFDKAHFVVSRLMKSFETQKTYKLQETYAEYVANGGEVGNVTNLNDLCYWCPTTIKDTHVALDMFTKHLSFNLSYFEEIDTDKSELV